MNSIAICYAKNIRNTKTKIESYPISDKTLTFKNSLKKSAWTIAKQLLDNNDITNTNEFIIACGFKPLLLTEL